MRVSIASSSANNCTLDGENILVTADRVSIASSSANNCTLGGDSVQELLVVESQSLLHQRITAPATWLGGVSDGAISSQSLLHQRITAPDVLDGAAHIIADGVSIASSSANNCTHHIYQLAQLAEIPVSIASSSANNCTPCPWSPGSAMMPKSQSLLHQRITAPCRPLNPLKTQRLPPRFP